MPDIRTSSALREIILQAGRSAGCNQLPALRCLLAAKLLADAMYYCCTLCSKPHTIVAMVFVFMFFVALETLALPSPERVPCRMHNSRSVPQGQSTWTLPIAYIETSNDGVALLPLAELLSVAPELRGRSSNGLHLRRKGRSIPLGLVDANGALSDDDTLYFVGSRPSGDTTYFDAYTSVAAFEVWYDETLPPARLARDTATPEERSLRYHLTVERHVEEEHEYVQGWLDNDRYRQTQTTFVTETVPGEGWRWSVVYPNRPFSSILFAAPDPLRDDSILVELHYSSISDDIYTTPDNRLQLFYAGVLRDSATYDGVRDGVLRFTLRPARDGCIVDSLVFRNAAPTTAAQAVDFITTRGIEYAAAWRDRLVGACSTEQTESVMLTNFSSPLVAVCDTVAGRWGIYRGQPGVLFRIAARGLPQRLTIAVGDTLLVDTRYRFAVAWLDGTNAVQLFTENSPSAIAGLIGALPLGTPFAVALTDGRYVDDQLRTRLVAEGSSSVSSLQAGVAFVAVGVRGEQTLWHERTGTGTAALVQWIETSRAQHVRVSVPLDIGAHGLVATGSASIEHARARRCGGIELVTDTSGADYIVITHAAFRPAAERLAQYRSRRNALRARVVDVQDIFDAFGHGEKSPHAIKAFLRYASEQWRKPAPRAVLLVGDASWDPRKVSSGAINDDFIPSYGKPVSDYWYTLLDSSTHPAMSIGRLPVRTVEEAQAIVDKIIEHDTMPWQHWQKQFLLITGGANPDEQLDFYQSVVYSLLPLLVDPYQRALCADTTLVSLYAGTATGAPIPAAIVTRINSGAMWVNYIGHGAPRTLEVGGWEPERLANRGRYPILASFSCQIGAFAEPSIQALGEDFLTAPNAGMIAVIATTGFGIRSYDDIVNSGIIATIARTPLRTLGDLLNAAKQYLNDGSQLAINTAMQTTLLGDPLTRVPLDTVPHPVLDRSTLSIASVPPAPILSADADSVRIEATVFNAGVHSDSTVEFRILHTYQQRTDTVMLMLDGLCSPERITFTLPIHRMPGEHVLSVVSDPEGIGGARFDTVTISFYVYGEQLLAVEPQPGWDVSPRDTVVRFLNPLAVAAPYSYQALLLSSTGDTLATSEQSPVEQRATHCQWRIPIAMQPGHEYRILLRALNIASQTWTPWLRIPVVARDSVHIGQVEHLQGQPSWSESVWDSLSLQSDGSLAFTTSVNIELMSAGGYQERRSDTLVVVAQPGYRLRIGGVNVASERSDETGVHLAVISARDGSVRAVRWFATWTQTPVPRSAGGPAELVTFLRDSIAADEYLAMVSCGQAWGLQYAQYASSVAEALALYGADSAALLSGGRSYLFVGMRSSSRPLVAERIGNQQHWQGGDTLLLRAALPLYPQQATLHLPVAGPAEQWQDVHVDRQCTRSHLRLEIYGGATADQISTLITAADTSELSLADVDATQYPFLRIVVRLERDGSDDFSPCAITRAVLRYRPLPEFAATLQASETTPLRGDTIALRARAVNLVTRSGVRQTDVRWMLRDNTGALVPSETLPSSSKTLLVGDTALIALLATTSLPNQCTAALAIETPRDLYTFNNIADQALIIRADQTPPVVVAIADGSVLGDTAYVAERVNLDIVMLDSARISITDTTALTVRLNGALLQRVAESLAFYPTPAALLRWAEYPLARAGLSASVTLEQGVNVLLVTAQDAAGNRTTSRYVLVVPDALTLEGGSVAPNPAQESVLVGVHYRGFQQRVAAWLELYDALGRRVRSERVQLSNGSNAIALPLREQSSGGQLQSGTYFWRLWLEPVGNSQAIGGMIVVVR